MLVDDTDTPVASTYSERDLGELFFDVALEPEMTYRVEAQAAVGEPAVMRFTTGTERSAGLPALAHEHTVERNACAMRRDTGELVYLSYRVELRPTYEGDLTGVLRGVVGEWIDWGPASRSIVTGTAFENPDYAEDGLGSEIPAEVCASVLLRASDGTRSAVRDLCAPMPAEWDLEGCEEVSIDTPVPPGCACSSAGGSGLGGLAGVLLLAAAGRRRGGRRA